MSYNNFIDADTAQRAAYDHDQPAVAIIKHANPCGIAIGTDVADAHRRANDCDPQSAYGGVVASNRTVSGAMAEQVAKGFTEVVIAPDYEPEALEILQRKKAIRLLKLPEGIQRGERVEIRPISGGLLMQSSDRIDAVVKDAAGDTVGGDDPASWRLVCGDPADVAWRAIRAVKSNAIILVKAGASVGVGMGQVNRVDSCHLAVSRAGADRAAGSVGASDAFFPFADGLQVLLDAGVRAVVAPGGSVRDPEVIAAAAAAGVTMYFTGTRHFAH
jgi:phosphoribosylaminoimidazolecarboxamide formyltransferase/IMP cyclohydrolase